MKSGVNYRYQCRKAISIYRQLVRGWISFKVKIHEPVSFPKSGYILLNILRFLLNTVILESAGSI